MVEWLNQIRLFKFFSITAAGTLHFIVATQNDKRHHDLDKSCSLDVAELTALILEQDIWTQRPRATLVIAKSWFSAMHHGL